MGGFLFTLISEKYTTKLLNSHYMPIYSKIYT